MTELFSTIASWTLTSIENTKSHTSHTDGIGTPIMGPRSDKDAGGYDGSDITDYDDSWRGASDTCGPRPGAGTSLEAAIQAGELNARREGEINFWASTPNSKDLLELEKAFNNRFELKVKVKRTPLKSVQVANRLVIAGQAGQAVAADCAILSPPSLDVLIQLGLLEDFDWNGVFGREFPAIKRRVERLAARFRNKALELWHLFYVIAYRTDRLKKEELPKKWADPY